MKSIALVVQRYGEEVTGGAEYLCRAVAEQLAARECKATVLTTCARDYMTWKNEYAPGEETINGVRVLRFPVGRERDIKKFNELSERLFRSTDHSKKFEEEWMDAQGPYCPKLVDYLRAHAEGYDRVVFFTYLYWTTVRGIEACPDKAVLVPAAHDEPPIRLGIFRRVFSLARKLGFSTRAERDFVNTLFGTGKKPQFVGTFGLQAPKIKSDPESFGKRHGISGGYVLYLGRFSSAKKVDLLLDWHAGIRARRKDFPALVLAGEPEKGFEISEGSAVCVGRISEEEKCSAIDGALAVINPSTQESLGITLLEAWARGRPVLVNSECGVTRSLVDESNGGLYFGDEKELENAVLLLGNKKLNSVLARNGREFARGRFSWDRNIGNFM